MPPPVDASAHTRGADFQRLSRRTLAAFGVSGLQANFFGTCKTVHLMFFYTSVVGLAPRWFAVGMMLTTVWDAVSDPLMGILSDRTKWTWGRRRPYILIGLLPLAVSFYALLSPPVALTGSALGWYFTIAFFVLFTFRTIVETPLGSMAPELAQGYHERTRLAAYREAFGNTGDLCGLLVPIALMMALHVDMDDPATYPAARQAFRLTGGLACATALIALTVTYLGTYEDPTFQRDIRIGARKALRAIAGNRPFIVLLASSTLAGMGLGMSQSLIMFVFNDIVGISLVQQAVGFLVHSIAALSSYPFWVWFAKRYGKPHAFRLGMLASTFTFCSVFILGPKDLVPLYVVMASAGVANVGIWMLLMTMNADVIDVDELETGLRREGLYAGFGNFIRKTAGALGAGVVAFGLDVIGYQAAAVPTAETAFRLKLLFALPTTVCVLVALVVFQYFPLTRERHGEIMEQLHARRLALGVAHDDETVPTDPESHDRVTGTRTADREDPGRDGV